MSWASRAINFILNRATGKPADAQIVLHPATPVEAAVNAAASVLLPAAAAIPGVQATAVPLEALKQTVNAVSSGGAQNAASQALGDVVTTIGLHAKASVDDFLITKIGAANTALVDAGAEALAASAIAAMSASGNKTQAEIAEFLHNALAGFLTAPAPNPAAGSTS